MAILWAGLVAVVIAACWYWLARTLGWTSYSPAVHLGCLVVRAQHGPIAETVGMVLFLLLGSSLVAVVYGVLLRQMIDVSWSAGALLGLMHGLLFTAALPLIGLVDACVRSGRVPPPRRWGLGWGWPTPAVLAVGHALYGAVFGAVLTAF